MSFIILVRHGKSLWNEENRFTGWTDIDLSNAGIIEAKEAAKKIKKKNIQISMAYSSIFSRAHDTCKIILDELGLSSLQIIKDWRINERHYGNLQGLNKKETSDLYGKEQVFEWRRNYTTKPPLLEESRFINDKSLPIFKEIPKNKFPRGESLKDTLARVEVFCKEIIYNSLENEKNILISAHGNSIRAMIKLFENIDDESIDKLEVPTGEPIFYKYQSKKLLRN